MEIKLSCKDYSPYPYESDTNNINDTFKVSRFAEKEIINQIAQKFASTDIDDNDLLFDMLLTP